MKCLPHLGVLALVLSVPPVAVATEAEEKPADLLSADTFAGLAFRSIGPALMSGRVGDFAVNPRNSAHYYVAVCSGGVWKTTNAGVTYTPVFDNEGSYSIGCLAMDPSNPHVVWVGTGENNSQRSVSFGDGIYRTRDGGQHWENLGLKESEHIGMIAIDPRDTDVVYVAAQGPLWRSGGDRGLYKTVDGGQHWERVLHISDDTGVNEVHFDPRDPDVLYASAYQRRRRTWTLINGGPESALYKSTDAGANWRKLTHGIPEVDKGRIGLDISPANPDVVYAIIEAAHEEGGFFRSTDRGETWTKQSDYMATSPQYYNEIVCDPQDVDRVYTLDTVMHVTEDGGKTFNFAPRQDRHVDDHALWIDPDHPDHMLVGCDGGVYESFDRGAHWDFKANLPVTQFYKIAVDDTAPFYFVYGGTQDNNTLGGPSRTTSRIGIANENWFVTVFGDGFEPAIDPVDPNIVYSQWQYGNLVRHDRRSGQYVDIKPREPVGGEPLRWNWDAPLIISPHDHRRVYYAANRLFRSDDRGDRWTAISGDLTRQLDRSTLKVMNRIQSVDAVAKDDSTSPYGSCVALCESPLVEGLIYAGTDDGLVQVTEDGGSSWRKISAFPNVPELSYVSTLQASTHDADTVYAGFDNHKSGDFKPYLLRSTDRGRSWESIAGDLPDRDIVYAIREDHLAANLLFVGTEFGVSFTLDGGAKWIRLKGGMPTIAVRDLEIQTRENDLVLGTFGRGFYVLDDYSPLRELSSDTLEQDAALFGVKPALRYVEDNRLGGYGGRGWQGASFYAASNPPFGAVFTYYLKDKLRSQREHRRAAEKDLKAEGKPVRYPAYAEIRQEDEEQEPVVRLTVRDAEGTVLRRLPGPRDKGMHRVAWDLRYPAGTPVDLTPAEDRFPWEQDPVGPLALPGSYTVALDLDVNGETSTLAGPISFEVVPLERSTFEAEDRLAVLQFRRQVLALQRAVTGAQRAAGEMGTRIRHLQQAVLDTPELEVEALASLRALELRRLALLTTLSGDKTRRSRNIPDAPAISERVDEIVFNQWNVTSPPTRTQQAMFASAGKAFAFVLDGLHQLAADLDALETRLEAAGAPWTPGRLPTWERE